MSNVLTRAKTSALNHVIDCLSKPDLTADIAPDLTCAEVETIYNLLLEWGRTNEANGWLNSHAIADRNPDALHYARGEALRAAINQINITSTTNMKEKK